MSAAVATAVEHADLLGLRDPTGWRTTYPSRHEGWAQALAAPEKEVAVHA